VSLLEIRGLRAGYGHAEVLHGVDLALAEGGVTAVLGANGAGKTTFLRAISGLTWRRGSVSFRGEETAGSAAEGIAASGVGHVPEGRGTFPRLTVRENLQVGAYRRRDRTDVAADLDRWLSFFPALARRRDQPAGLISGGEQQMLAIARALMGRPRLLLLDEPSAGLAPGIVESVFAALGEINRESGMAMLVVEQNVVAVSSLATTAAVLANGLITGRGTVAELVGDGDVRQAYLGA
jgi:branched-chain amino acid transport system ATP-binding protein